MPEKVVSNVDKFGSIGCIQPPTPVNCPSTSTLIKSPASQTIAASTLSIILDTPTCCSPITDNINSSLGLYLQILALTTLSVAAIKPPCNTICALKLYMPGKGTL